MLLIKCECGSLFALKGDKQNFRLKCPSCERFIQIYEEMELRELKDVAAQKGFTVQSIPDDAKITVTFDT